MFDLLERIANFEDTENKGIFEALLLETKMDSIIIQHPINLLEYWSEYQI